MSGRAEQVAVDLSMTALAFLGAVAAVIGLALWWGRSWRDGLDDGGEPEHDQRDAGDQGPRSRPRPPHH